MVNMENVKEIALVTGANRGIGLGSAKALAELGHHVIMTGRNTEELTKAVEELTALKLPVESFFCDITDETSIRNLRTHIEKKFGHLDILINNAGIVIDRLHQAPTEIPADVLMKTFNTNTLGPYRMMVEMLPLLQKSKMARIVNMSSTAGSLAQMEGRIPAYRVSKAGLNALTRVFSAEYSSEKLKINSVCPNWVKTKMGGRDAPFTVDQITKHIVWAATLGPDGPSGGFYRDGEAIPW